MKQIYLLCKNIDLGYHAVEAFFTEEAAIIEMNRLNQLEWDKKVLQYGEDYALSYFRPNEWYDVDTVVLSER